MTKQKNPARRSSPGSGAVEHAAQLTRRSKFFREPVSRAAYGLHHPIIAERFERLAQATDMHVDGALLDIDVLAPHAVEHLLPGVNAFRMADQKMQQTIFSRTEMDRLPVGGNTLAGDIDLKDRESTRMNSSQSCAPRLPTLARKK